MNILFISNSDGKKTAGLTYSIPKQIESASKYDNVFWYNLCPLKNENWEKKKYYHNINDYPCKKIKFLPEPFNNPDIIVFQQMYDYVRYYPLLLEVMKRKIPYIIIPRSELTEYAQKKSMWKKRIANFLFFDKFVKKAAAIQYLTNDEKINSGSKWNKKFFINSNGIQKAKILKENFSEEKIKCVSISRIEPYQKGLDLLIEACKNIKNILEKNNVNIDIYGSGDKEELRDNIKKYEIEHIIKIHDAIYDLEKEKILLESDIFLLTSRFEGHPMGLIEALSYGLPCLITEGTNMKDKIEEYDAGWVTDISVKGIEKAFIKMIEDKKFFKNKSKNTVELSKIYDWDNIAKISHEKYWEIVNKKG